MKRKNTQHPNPQQLLNNLEQRKSQHQKLSIITRQSRSRSKNNSKTPIQYTPTKNDLTVSSHQYYMKKDLSNNKQGLSKSMSDQKNRSLKNIYCKTLVLSPSQKQKFVFTPKPSSSRQPTKYTQLLDLFRLPSKQSNLNQMIKDVNNNINTILDKFYFDEIISILFKRIQQTIGLLLEQSVLNSISMINEQQKLVLKSYNSIIEQNKYLNTQIQQMKYNNKMLEDDFKKILKQNQELSIDICNKLKKQKQVNQLIYQMRLYGIDIDLFYVKMKHPQYQENSSQATFTIKHLSKGTI